MSYRYTSASKYLFLCRSTLFTCLRTKVYGLVLFTFKIISLNKLHSTFQLLSNQAGGKSVSIILSFSSCHGSYLALKLLEGLSVSVISCCCAHFLFIMVSLSPFISLHPSQAQDKGTFGEVDQ